jgi:hypothetical protein
MHFNVWFVGDNVTGARQTKFGKFLKIYTNFFIFGLKRGGHDWRFSYGGGGSKILQ